LPIPALARRAVSAALAFGLFTASAPPPTSAAPPAAGDVTRTTLSNGLRVVVVRDPLAPVVSEIVNYLVGSQDTPAGFPGMAHAQEHMAAGRSTKDVDANQAATITTLLGGDFDADTQTAVTQYYITLPADYLDIALKLEAARMRDTLDLQSEWAEERGAIEQEVSRDQSSAIYRYFDKATQAIFAGTPYDHTALGTRASFDKTTGPLLKSFWKKWYAPNNAVLVIAGNVDPKATIDQVTAIFGGIPRRAVPAHAPVKLETLPSGTTINDESDLGVPVGLLAYRMPGYRDPDYYAAEIAVDVLQSQRGAVFGLSAEGKALQTLVDYQPSPLAGLALAGIVVPPGADLKAAVALLSDTIGTYQKDGAPADLVEASIRREVASALFTRNSIDGLASEWSDAIAVRGLQSPDDAVAHFEAVKPADVTRALRTYFVRDKAVAGYLLPKPGAVPSGGGGLGVKDTFGSKDTKPVPLPSWAARLSQPPSIPKSLVAPSDVTLANGIRLIVQPERVSPTVTLVGKIANEPVLQEPAGKEGVDGLLGALFSYGTATYDRVAFQKELDAIAANESAGASFSLSVPAKDFERGVALLAENELHPALPPQYFKIVQAQTAQALQGELTTPDYLASRALLKGLLPAGDPRLRETTPATVATVTLDDVKAYENSVFRPDLTTIVVAGDIAPDAAKAIVEKYFGGWSASGEKPVTDLAPVPQNASATVAVTAPTRTQETVTLAQELGTLDRDSTDAYALQLGNAILGGAFYSTRFSRDLRKDNGLVYSISAGLRAGKTRAAYTVEFGSDPKNVAKAVALIDKDLHDIATVPPSASEMAQAKTQLVRELSLGEASVDAIAGQLLGDASDGRPLDHPTRRATALVGIDAPTVTAAFAKWIDPKRFVQVNEGPPLP
jgi:zinc protease